ncbi:YidH family protein [Gordonia humi]|uniref:Putative membrane protein n=1 Tax=Gordonia humi TaxID=686429 RepID=A0A840EXC7_9ACTN|nr:DUF202 domain-containing protein [Gordonia humi]MBB4133579.1 putative membrane protein [Gordonia humi]
MSEQSPPPGAVDARFTLAAERTLLAWLRTALGLVAAGVAVLHVVGEFASPALQTALGIVLIVLGIASAVVGSWRWYRVTHSLENGGPMPAPIGIWLLIGGLVVVSVAFIFVR